MQAIATNKQEMAPKLTEMMLQVLGVDRGTHLASETMNKIHRLLAQGLGVQSTHQSASPKIPPMRYFSTSGVPQSDPSVPALNFPEMSSASTMTKPSASAGSAMDNMDLVSAPSTSVDCDSSGFLKTSKNAKAVGKRKKISEHLRVKLVPSADEISGDDGNEESMVDAETLPMECESDDNDVGDNYIELGEDDIGWVKDEGTEESDVENEKCAPTSVTPDLPVEKVNEESPRTRRGRRPSKIAASHNLSAVRLDEDSQSESDFGSPHFLRKRPASTDKLSVSRKLRKTTRASFSATTGISGSETDNQSVAEPIPGGSTVEESIMAEILKLRKFYHETKRKDLVRNMKRVSMDDVWTLKCFKCPKSYTDYAGFRKHMQEDHIAGNISNITVRGRHWTKFFNSGDNSCRICKTSFSRRDSVKFHILTRHGDTDYVYKCEHCNRILAHKSLLQRHWAKCKGASMKQKIPYRCQVCRQSYLTANRLQSHLRNKHADAKLSLQGETKLVPKKGHPLLVYICHHCDQLFQRRLNLFTHIVMVHELNKEVKYEDQEIRDDSSQASKSDSRRESVESIVKDYKCQFCTGSFDTLRGLRVHMSHKHEKEASAMSSFKCELCGQLFASSVGLQIHKGHRHPGGKSHAISTTSVAENNLPHKCKFCSYRFKTYAACLLHMTRKHPNAQTSGGSLIPCERCDRVFKNHMALTIHSLRAHKIRVVSDKKYSCKLCSGIVGKMKQMRRHVYRLHPGYGSSALVPFAERPPVAVPAESSVNRDGDGYKCCPCKKTFISKEGYDRHMRTSYQHNIYKRTNTRNTSVSTSPSVAATTKDAQTRMHHCSPCGRDFTTLKGLAKHRSFVHKSSIWYSCPMCNKEYSQQGALNTHLAEEHAGADVDQMNQMLQSLKEDGATISLACKVCKLDFATAEEKSEHMKTHNCEYQEFLNPFNAEATFAFDF